MDAFGVARTTVRRAIAYLRETGAVRTVAGRGSYVAGRGRSMAHIWRTSAPETVRVVP
jgi:DNA-binding GntR family transcriptional regulator